MADGGRDCTFSRSIHLRISITVDISIYKNYVHQIWQASTSRRVNSDETNETDVNGIITSRLSDFEKML